MRYYLSSNLKIWNNASRICIVIVLLLLGCVLFTACDANCNGINNCNNNNSGPSGNNYDPGTSGGGNPVPVDCSGYQPTGVDNTATYTVNVPDGCDMIVQAVVGQGVGSYNWDNGGVVAVGPGNYTITLTSGSYLITSEASAPKAFCDAVAYVQQGHPDGFGNYPLPGWGSC